jgi:2-iminobutanoate/2-iminopropanoate deaminase
MSRITKPAVEQHATAGPYSPALRVAAGDMLVLSGQGPIAMDGSLIGTDIREQTAATLDNCKRLLAASGADLSSVFRVNAYLADLDDWPAFNEEYELHFPPPRPARTAVGVKLLLGMKVELDLWAAAP